jgi:very-short-patch-repair endonuclease
VCLGSIGGGFYNMKDDRKIISTITEYLYNYKANELNAVCKKYNIPCNEDLNPMHSKKTYVRSGLNDLSFESLQKIAINIIQNNECPLFVEKIDGVLELDPFEITMVTRRNLIDIFSKMQCVEGTFRIDDFLNRIFDLENMESQYNYLNAHQDIIKHMINNDDISYDIMYKNLKLLYVSDNVFKKFLEQLVHPKVRIDTVEQNKYIKLINDIICYDGFKLVEGNLLSGRPTYKVEKTLIGGVNSEIKNIIFASIKQKPDIVIYDTLSNNIKIVNNDDNDCLIYNLPISKNGLSWHNLVSWWNEGNEDYNLEKERELYARLNQTLDSEPEKVFMREYYKYSKDNGNTFPALLPQVYCHYDPKSAKMRGGQVYVHQRMDFLILISDTHRVVIEIDGQQHYSENKVASPKLYSAMVKDDRKLKIYGYDVYRFGGYEFIDTENPQQMIKEFIVDLYKKYDISL